jgi:hypothetical protein
MTRTRDALDDALAPACDRLHWFGGDEATLDGREDLRDFVNHELRTPLTAAGTALQTLALQLADSGGRPLELVDLALRNLRRLERTVDWAADYLGAAGGADRPASASVVPLTDLLADLDDLAGEGEISWATDAGDWSQCVAVDRAAWRRLLRQVARALVGFVPRAPVHLGLSLLAPSAGEESCGLLLVGNLPLGDEDPDQAEAHAGDPAGDLQRMLGLTVHPDLAERLDLRADVVRLTGRLRLRLLLCLPCAAADALPA